MRPNLVNLFFLMSCMSSAAFANELLARSGSEIPIHCEGDNIQTFGDITGSFSEDAARPGTGKINFGGWIDGLEPFSRSGSAQVSSDGTIEYNDYDRTEFNLLTLDVGFVDQSAHPNEKSRIVAVNKGRRGAQAYELNCRFEESTQPEEPFCRGMSEPCKDIWGRWSCCGMVH